jgi:lipid intermediate transporter
MFVCINCGIRYSNMYTINSNNILKCKKCTKRIDKYFELNNTLLLIDLLLLKKEVIRHIIYNRMITTKRFGTYTSLLYLSNILRFCANYSLSDVLSCSVYLFMEFMLYFIFIKTYLKLEWKNIRQTLLLSFYWFFYYFMVIWKYEEIEYTIIVEFLVLVGNSVGLSCVCDYRLEEVFITCFVSRILSNVLVNYIIKDKLESLI